MTSQTLTTVEAIAAIASRDDLSIAVAESLTSGLITSELGKGPDAATWLVGGIVAYSPAVKHAVLNVAEGPIITARCAQEMATGVARLLKADVTIATTGVGGPDPVEDRAPGTVFIGWRYGGRIGHREYAFEGTPEIVVERTVQSALELLLDVLDDSARRQPTAP